MIKMIISGKEFHDLEKLKKTLNVVKVSDEANLKKQLIKGNNVYAYICPFSNEIHDEIVLHWDLNKDAARDSYDNAREEI